MHDATLCVGVCHYFWGGVGGGFRVDSPFGSMDRPKRKSLGGHLKVLDGQGPGHTSKSSNRPLPLRNPGVRAPKKTMAQQSLQRAWEQFP